MDKHTNFFYDGMTIDEDKQNMEVFIECMEKFEKDRRKRITIDEIQKEWCDCVSRKTITDNFRPFYMVDISEPFIRAKTSIEIVLESFRLQTNINVEGNSFLRQYVHDNNIEKNTTSIWIFSMDRIQERIRFSLFDIRNVIIIFLFIQKNYYDSFLFVIY